MNNINSTILLCALFTLCILPPIITACYCNSNVKRYVTNIDNKNYETI